MGALAGDREEKRGKNGRLKMGGSPDPSKSGPVAAGAPDPEVQGKAVRRQHSAKYKLRILDKVDGCKEPGEIGKILRREGLYSSYLTTWRRQRDEGTLKGLKPKKRGRKTREKNPLEAELKKVRRENVRLQRKLEQAETIIDIQKKVSTLLGIPLETPKNEEND
jgi:transposase